MLQELTRKYPLFGYFAAFKPDRKRVVLALLLAAIKHTPVFVIPLYTAFIVDHVIPSASLTDLLLCALGMVAMIVINLTIHPLFIRLYSQARRDVALRLRARLCERIQQLAFAYTDSANSGRLHSKVMQDVEKLEILGRVLVDPLLMALMSMVGAVLIVLFVQPAFALIFLGFWVILPLYRRFLGKRVTQNFNQLRVEQEKLNAEVGEMIEMLTLSRAHATEEEDLRRIGRRLSEVRNVGLRTDWLQHLLWSQLWCFVQLANILVVCIGAYFVIDGSLSIGGLVLAMSLVGMSLWGMNVALSQMETIMGANEAMRSINEILALPDIENNEGKPALPAIEGAIAFRDVWFTYPGTDQPVLKSLSLECEPNQTVALVGGSGAGKTTFMKLLLGFYEPLQGSVCIDGRDIHDFDKRTLRRQVGIVTQETFLFNGTVLQNIAHGLGDVPLERIVEAAKLAHAHEFVSALPEGYETEIGDRGVKLSGGQKQRIAIARALLRDPRLLLLDEATSSLDSQSERHVQEALEELMKHRTTFVIAHRLSTVRNADRILVFDDGRIVEEGRHELLLHQNGVYTRLVELQTVS